MSEFRDVKKILVIKLRHIGDVLLTIPAIRAVRDTFPEAHITALVNSGTEDMLSENPLTNGVLVLDRPELKQPLVKRVNYELSFLKRVRREKFDMSIDLTGGDRPALYSFISGARYRIGYAFAGGFMGKRLLYTHSFNVDRERHVVLQPLELLSKVGIQTDNFSVDFHISAEDERWMDNALRDRGIEKNHTVVHIHPTSRWVFKCWKDEYVAEIIDRIQELYGAKVILTCSPEKREMDKAIKIVGHTRTKPISFIGNISLKKLGAISKRARLFFGVDSAPMHIAAAVATPVVALFGPSGAFHWGPWDNDYSQEPGVKSQEFRNPYQKRNGIQTFGKHTVIQRDWDCIPCGKDGCDGSKISRCLDDIGVEEVSSIIKEELKSIGNEGRVE